MITGRLMKRSDIAPRNLSEDPGGERDCLATTLRDEAVSLVTLKVTTIFEAHEGVLIEARDVCGQTLIVA